MKKYISVTQSNHGHEYRWIFEEKEIKKNVNEIEYGASGIYMDVGFPIGGSNSSATSFVPLKTDTDIKAFLVADALGPELEDPTLVDIAEYLLTVDVDCGSCTQEFLDKFGFTMKELEQYDDIYHHRANAERMIAEILSSESELRDAIDSESPFYGESSDMRYSELCEIYDEYLRQKNDAPVISKITPGMSFITANGEHICGKYPAEYDMNEGCWIVYDTDWKKYKEEEILEVPFEIAEEIEI